jgi:hypothetical protein
MPRAEARRYDTQPRSYFYRDPGNPISADETLFHEGSHQLLFESAGPTAYADNQGNYWLWEGLGNYFETLVTPKDRSYEIGGLVGARIAKAYDDIVVKMKLVPTADLVAMDKRRFQADPAVYQHYPEAMALVVFLMHHDRGRYRERFLDYVSDAYHGRLRSDSGGRALSRGLGISYDELDRELSQFLKDAFHHQATVQ